MNWYRRIFSQKNTYKSLSDFPDSEVKDVGPFETKIPTEQPRIPNVNRLNRPKSLNYANWNKDQIRAIENLIGMEKSDEEIASLMNAETNDVWMLRRRLEKGFDEPLDTSKLPMYADRNYHNLHWNEESERYILDLFQRGMNITDISRFTGIGRIEIRNLLLAMEVIPPTKPNAGRTKLTPEQDEDVARLFDQGMSHSNIVRELGVTPGAVKGSLIRSKRRQPSRGNT